MYPVKRLAESYAVRNMDSADYPALRGFWKCDDGSNTVHDYSQYGNHLAMEFSGDGFNSETCWTTKPGWLCIKNHDRARIALTPSLTIGDKFIVVGCEFENENVLSDCDMGTAYNSAGIAAGEYRGFSVASLGDVVGLRVSEYAPGLGPSGHPDLIFHEAITSGNPLLSPFGFAGALLPSTSVRASFAGDVVVADTGATTPPASIEAQDSTFALAGARNSGFEAITGYTAVRNYQLWAFATQPPHLEYSLRWLSEHPGCIPPWWGGLE